MKKGWRQSLLGDLCDICNGSTPSKTNSEFWNGGNIPWFTIDDIREQGDRIVSTRQHITQLALNKTSVKLLPAETVLLCCTASVGVSAIAKIPLTTNQQFNGLVIKDRSQLNPYFLFHYTNTLKEKLSKLCGKTTIDFIPISRLRSISVPVPPLFEQERIVAIVDEAFAGIATVTANAERNLNNSSELFESYLESVLSNPKYKIKNLGAISLSFQYGTSSKSVAIGKVPVLRMGNIQDGRFSWDDLVYSSDDDEIEKYSLKYDDVLFNRTNSLELVGKTAIYKGEMPAIFAGYLIRIKRDETMLDGDYLNYYLNSRRARKYGRTVVISSVHQANINATKLMSYPVPTPTLTEQKTIVSKLDELQAESKKLRLIYHQKLSKLNELKQSVLHQAFSGQLH